MDTKGILEKLNMIIASVPNELFKFKKPQYCSQV